MPQTYPSMPSFYAAYWLSRGESETEVEARLRTRFPNLEAESRETQVDIGVAIISAGNMVGSGDPNTMMSEADLPFFERRQTWHYSCQGMFEAPDGKIVMPRVTVSKSEDASFKQAMDMVDNVFKTMNRESLWAGSGGDGEWKFLGTTNCFAWYD